MRLETTKVNLRDPQISDRWSGLGSAFFQQSNNLFSVRAQSRTIYTFQSLCHLNNLSTVKYICTRK